MTTAKEYGFRICGMTIKNPSTGTEVYKYGKTDSPRDLDEAQEFLENFFDKGDGKFDT